MPRYGMVIDVNRCLGCYNCFLACRDEHAEVDHRPVAVGQPQSGHRWIDVRELERGSFPKMKVSYLPVPCQHCAEAPCIAAAVDGGVYRRDDGIVLINPDKAAGQQAIVDSCPYGAIFWNSARNIPQKCTFCAHLLDDGWTGPRCVEVCPTRAIVFGDLDNPRSDIAKMHADAPVENLHPEYETKPLISYLALPKRFLTGEIVFADSSEIPAQGVKVSLRGGDRELIAITDNYGDFEFNGLDGVPYALSVQHPGYRPQERVAIALDDVSVGTIMLEPIHEKTVTCA